MNAKYQKSLNRQEQQPHAIRAQNTFDYGCYRAYLAEASVSNFGKQASHPQELTTFPALVYL